MSELREHTDQVDVSARKRDEQVDGAAETSGGQQDGVRESRRDQEARRDAPSPSSAFITLDDGTRKNAPASRRRTAMAALGAVACVALIVVCLGFVRPSETGGWSIAWLFQTTEEAQVAEEPAGNRAASGQDAEDPDSSNAGAQEQADAADAATEGEGGDAAAPEGADTSSSSNGGAGTGAGAGADSSTSSSYGAGTSSNGGSTHGGASSDSGEQGGASSSNPGGAGGAAEQPQTVTISVSVDSSSVGSPVSASGTYTIEKGATAYDALCALGISVNASGSQFGVYVSAIGGLAEKEHGATSGWLYTVNGAQPTSAASSYVLSDGDVVRWVYSVSE